MSILKIADDIKLPSHGSIVSRSIQKYNNYDREIGEYWEEVVLKNLSFFGIRAYRPQQDFNTPQDKKRIIKGLKPLNKIDYSIYSKQQRDILIKIPNSTKRICLEVKSKKRAFDYNETLVGKTKTWDAKQFPVHYLAVIDQNTKECRVTKADIETRNTVWSRNKNFEQECYEVPKNKLIPLDKWIYQNSYLRHSDIEIAA